MMNQMSRKKYIKNPLKIVFFAFIAVCGFPLAAQNAQSYYVKATGFDINNGLAENAPFRTLGKAVEAARQSEIKIITVIGELTEASESALPAQLRDPLRESVFYIRNSGTVDIIITGKNNAVLSASGMGKRVLKIEGNSRISIQNIVVSGGKSASGGGMAVGKNALVTLKDGAFISGNTGTSGGGIFVSGAFTLAGGAVSKNTATNGGGIFLAPADDGGGILSMTGGEISSNQAANAGGGVTISRGCLFTLDNGAIWGNKAQGGGGVAAAGVENSVSSFTMNNGVISSNQAVWGSGVYLYEGVFVMTNGRINTNAAQDSGGGVWSYNGFFSLINGTIANNKASRNGGGVCLSEGGTLDMTGGIISGNSSVCGGGVYTGGYNTFTKTGGVIYGLATAQSNKAGGNGDAAYKSNGAKHRRNTTLDTAFQFGSDSDEGWE
jgi:hypothetical protein